MKKNAGCLGFIWLVAWRTLYHPPGQHPRVSPQELQYIRAAEPMASPAEAGSTAPPTASWRKLLRYRQTWGIVLGRMLLDPYWFLVADWFAVYLVSKGFRLERSVLGEGSAFCFRLPKEPAPGAKGAEGL